MTERTAEQQTRSHGSPDGILVALLLLGSLLLTLTAAHAMCATSDGAMHESAAMSSAHDRATPLAAGLQAPSAILTPVTPTHQMQGLLDCVMAGIACLLVALLLIGLLRLRHDPVPRDGKRPASRAPPRLHRTLGSPSVIVLCVSRT